MVWPGTIRVGTGPFRNGATGPIGFVITAIHIISVFTQGTATLEISTGYKGASFFGRSWGRLSPILYRQISGLSPLIMLVKAEL